MRSKIRWFTDSANHTTYRISLRSSSLREPRHPLLRVVTVMNAVSDTRVSRLLLLWFIVYWEGARSTSTPRVNNSRVVWMNHNDPSAGSPTETLLRLLLPLNDKV